MAIPPSSDLARFVDLLWVPGDVREVRIPAQGRIDSGYFDSPEALVAAVSPLDGRDNMYLTVNPVAPALLARAANRIQSRSRTTTGDAQIVDRRWLPIDIDPQRPSNISASEEEREAALEVTRKVWVYLNELGWPEPVVAMSGNGYWMLYPIVLDNSAASTALVAGVLGHLAERFNTPMVSIDTTVSNASRIIALIGTLKVKGDATADRPHRRSGLLRTPKELVPVPTEKLAKLGEAVEQKAPVIVVTPDRATGDRMPEGWVAKLLDAAGIAYRATSRKGNLWYRLDQCPFHPDDDRGGDCGVGEDPAGKAVSHCFHNRGAGKTWQDFKVALGLQTNLIVLPTPPTQPRPPARGIDAADLLELDLPPLRWIVPDLIPEGTTIIASPPKVGKSCFVYQVVVEAALGGEFLGRKVERGSALYLALEDGKRRGQGRLRAALAGRSMPRGFLEVRWDAPTIGQGLEEDVSTWLDAHPDAVIVAIDTLQKVRPSTTGKRGAYEVDVEDLGRLQAIFRGRRVTLLIVHHARKDASDDFLTSVSGTYGITGSADTIIVIRRKRIEAFGQVYVTGRDVADAEVSVRFDGMLWSSAPASLVETSFERMEVFSVIETEGPVFPAAIAERTGLSRTSVQNMVTAMVDKGLVVRTTKGYVAIVTGVIVQSVADDSDDSVEGSRARTRDAHNPDDSDDSVIGVIEGTYARESSWRSPCRDYSHHQSSHRMTPAGWVCDVCAPEPVA